MHHMIYASSYIMELDDYRGVPMTELETMEFRDHLSIMMQKSKEQRIIKRRNLFEEDCATKFDAEDETNATLEFLMETFTEFVEKKSGTERKGNEDLAASRSAGITYAQPVSDDKCKGGRKRTGMPEKSPKGGQSNISPQADTHDGHPKDLRRGDTKGEGRKKGGQPPAQPQQWPHHKQQGQQWPLGQQWPQGQQWQPQGKHDGRDRKDKGTSEKSKSDKGKGVQGKEKRGKPDPTDGAQDTSKGKGAGKVEDTEKAKGQGEANAHQKRSNHSTSGLY